MQHHWLYYTAVDKIMDKAPDSDSDFIATPHYEQWQQYTAEDWLLFSLQCAIGEQDGEPDYVAAHVWLNIAAIHGNEDARVRRAELAAEMSREDIAKAQRIARAITEAPPLGH